MTKHSVYPIILCGGSGTRLWPLSRELYPKQFMDLGQGHTLFQDTISRAMQVPGTMELLVVCNEVHRFYATEGLNQGELSGQIILEPAPRNTAPAVALAAYAAMEHDGNDLSLIHI